MAGAHIIDMDDLISSMKEEFSSMSRDTNHSQAAGNPVICRIQQHIRDKHNVYEPNLLSIGPYNYGISATQAMQKTKYEFLGYILRLNSERTLADYIETMLTLEDEVRSCYGDAISMSRNEFCKMLLLDGCFVLASLHGIKEFVPEMQESGEAKEVMNEEADHDGTDPTDQSYSQNIWRDLLLLENQIPFFVILKIHELIGGRDTKSTLVLVEKIAEPVEGVLSCYPKAINKFNRPKQFCHLLHLCHLYFIPHQTETEIHDNQFHSSLFQNFLKLGSSFYSKIRQIPYHQGLQAGQQANRWRRTTEYHRVGINLTRRKFCSESPHSLLDIAFSNGLIEIPCLTIDPNTQSLFCNLIALEQTGPQFGSYVTSYIVFLSCLVSKPEDASLLTKEGIIVHQLNTDSEVSELIKIISQCIVSDFDSNRYLKPLCRKLEAYYHSRRTILNKFIGSTTSKIRGWAQKIEYSELPMTMSQVTSE